MPRRTTNTVSANFARVVGTSLDLTDGDATNLGDINCDSISVDAAAAGLNIDFSGGNTGTGKISLGAGTAFAPALDIKEGTNSYLLFDTNTPQIVIGQNWTAASKTCADLGSVTTCDINGGTIDGVTIGASTGTFSGVLSVDDATQSTSTTSGSIHTDGGLGVVKAATIGGAVAITDSTDSTSTSTGCLKLTGGLGVAKNIYCNVVHRTPLTTATSQQIPDAPNNNRVVFHNGSGGDDTITFPDSASAGDLLTICNIGSNDCKIQPGGSGDIYKRSTSGNVYPGSGSMVELKVYASITWAYSGSDWFTVSYSGTISND
jgi:hypothetical protein